VARDESLEDVLANEERDAMALLEQQDSARDLEKIGVRDLKELVAGKRLQDLDERLAVVASWIEPGLVERALEFQAQHRDLAHAADVRGRSEQPEETVLADELTLVVVTLDADAIHRHRTMDRASIIRLGDNQQIFAARVRAELRRERL